MFTITPRLAPAIVSAGTRSTVSSHLLAVATASTLEVGAFTIFVLVLGLIFMAAAAQAIRDLARVLAQLVRSAVTIGSALVVVALVAVALIVLLIHH